MHAGLRQGGRSWLLLCPRAPPARCASLTPHPARQASEYLFYQGHGGGEQAEDAPESLTRAQVVAAVTWLRSVGLSAEQVPAVITAHPTLLAYDVPTRLAPLGEYLGSLGVSGDRLATALVQRPSLLGLSVDKNMKLMVDYLLSTGTEKDKVIEYLLTTL